MRLSAIVVASLLPTAIAAQEVPAPQQVAAMERLQIMVGRWEGDGWIMRGPGNRVEFTSSETIQPMIGGLVLLVEGIHEAMDESTGERSVVHHAAGMFSYDPETGDYRFAAHLANGRSGVYQAAWNEDGKFIWRMNLPNRQIRYTITVTDRQWIEVGESSADGERWFQFFEMTLARM